MRALSLNQCRSHENEIDEHGVIDFSRAKNVSRKQRFCRRREKVLPRIRIQ